MNPTPPPDWAIKLARKVLSVGPPTVDELAALFANVHLIGAETTRDRILALVDAGRAKLAAELTNKAKP